MSAQPIGRRFDLSTAILLLVGGLYLSISWFLGYVWAGIWNFGPAQNLVSVFLGLYFAVVWIGFLLARRNSAYYWLTAVISCVALAILLCDFFKEDVLALHVFPLDVIFTAVALAAVVLRRYFFRIA